MAQHTSRDEIKSRREKTRERLLKAGREILTTEPIGGIGTHVRSVDVTKRAKLSAGSLYYHWMSQDEYIYDLVEYMLRSISEGRETLAKRQAHSIYAAALANEPFPAAARAAGDQVFAQLQDDPTVYVQMALWAAHCEDPEISRRLKDMYQKVEACWIAKIDRAVQDQGRQWRPPFTAQLFTTTLIALAEGLLLRIKVDPNAVSDLDHPDGQWSVFATATLGLYEGVTAPVGNEESNPPEDVRDLSATS